MFTSYRTSLLLHPTKRHNHAAELLSAQPLHQSISMRDILAYMKLEIIALHGVRPRVIPQIVLGCICNSCGL